MKKLTPGGLVTTPKRDLTRFTKERLTGIGGSDVGAILGIDSFRTALDVYHEKVGEKAPTPPGPDILRGQWFEPLALHLYASEQERLRVRPEKKALRDPSNGFLLCHIDAWLDVRAEQLDPEQEYEGIASVEETLVAEVKCPRQRTLRQWELEGVPAKYVAQMQHMLGITGAQAGVFVLFNAELFKVLGFRIERDQPTIDNLRTVLRRWWAEHVMARKAPESDQTNPLEVELKAHGGTLVRISETALVKAAESYLESRELEALAESYKKQAGDALKALGPGVYETGDVRFTVTAVDGRKGFDKERLAGVRPLDPRKIVSAEQLHRLAEEDRFDEVRLDLGEFEKVGKPYTTINVHRLRGED